MQKPPAVYMLIALHTFLSIGAIIGGAMLMLKPDGSLLGMQKFWLNHSPFNNYFVPGLILFTFNGLLSLITCAGLLFDSLGERKGVLNIYVNRNWAWTYSLYTGIIAIVWIAVQQVMTYYFWLQTVIIATGLCILILTLMPGVMNFYETRQKA